MVFSTLPRSGCTACVSLSLAFFVEPAAELTSIFFFQAEDGIRDKLVTGVQTCALPIWVERAHRRHRRHLRRVGATAPGHVGHRRERPLAARPHQRLAYALLQPGYVAQPQA